GERGQGEEVAGGRGVRLDREVASAVMRGVDVETAKLAVARLDSEGFHHGQGHGDIRSRDEDTVHLDRDRVSGIRTRHQQTAEELTGDVATHGAETPVQAARLDRDGRAARSQVAAGSDTQ